MIFKLILFTMNMISNIRAYQLYFKESFLSTWNPTVRMITIVALAVLAVSVPFIYGMHILPYLSSKFHKFLCMKDPLNLVDEKLFETLKKCENLLKHSPNNADGYHNFGVLLPEEVKYQLGVNRYFTKQDFFLKSIELAPNKVDNYRRLAETLPKGHAVTLLDGRKMTAQELYLEAIRIDPKTDWAYSYLRIPKGAHTIQLPNGTKMTRDELLIEAIHLNPKVARYYFNLACFRINNPVQLKNGTTMSSAELLKEAEKLDPNFNNEKYTIVNRLRAKLISNPHHKQSLLLNLIHLNPKESLLYLNLASTFKKTGQIQVQLLNGTIMTKGQLYLEAIQHQPKNGKSYYKLANFLPKGGHAVLLNKIMMSRQELYEEAIKLKPTFAQAYRNLGKILPLGAKAKVSHGKEMSKQELYLQAIDLNPCDLKTYKYLSETLPEKGYIRLLNGKLMSTREINLKYLNIEA